MPPPKRPKLAPISIEQFLSLDELHQLEQDVVGHETKSHSDPTHRGPLNLTTTTNRRTAQRLNNRLRALFCEDHDGPMTVSSWTLDNCRNSEGSACSSCILLRNRDSVIYNQAHTHSDVSVHLSNSLPKSNSQYEEFASDEPSDLSLKEPKQERSSTFDSDHQQGLEGPSVARSVTPTGGPLGGGQRTFKQEQDTHIFFTPVPQNRPLLTTVNPGKSIFSGGLPTTFTKSISNTNYYEDTSTITSQCYPSPRISSSTKTENIHRKGTEDQDPSQENQLRLLAATLTNRKKFLNQNQTGPWVSRWPPSHTVSSNVVNLPANEMAEELTESHVQSTTVTSEQDFSDHMNGDNHGSSRSGTGTATTLDQQPAPDSAGQGVQRKCQICNDLASGFHYGVWSCEGCKAFFKRSLQGPVDYMCPATNNCTIDKHRRKSCQACRFRKCLEVGMMKRRERRTTKKTKTPSLSEEKMNSKKVKTLHISTSKDVKSHKNCDMKSQTPPHTQGADSDTTMKESINRDIKGALVSDVLPPTNESTAEPSSFVLTPSPSSSSGSNSQSVDVSSFFINDLGLSLDQPHPLVAQLEQHDLPTKILGLTMHESNTEYSLLHKLIMLADMELIDIVNWAKALPGFSQLELNDRISLLESCWMELLCIGAAWRSRLNSIFQINFAEDVHFTEEAARMAKLSTIVGEIWQISRQFMYLQLSFQEFLLLRVITLLNSESVRLSSMDAMYRIRKQYLDALHFECGRTLGKISETSCVRMAQILCILPFARQVSLKSITHLFNIHNQHSIPVGQLVAEMLVAQKEIISSEDG